MALSEALRKEIVSGLFVAAGIYSIVHGLTAKKFAFRSMGGKLGEEKKEFAPTWKDRLLIVFMGIVVTVVSLHSLLALRR